MADEAENTQPEEQPQDTDANSESLSDANPEEAVEDAAAKMDEVAAQAEEGADVSDDEAAALAAAMSAINDATGGATDAASEGAAFESPELGAGTASAESNSELDLLSDVQMNVRIELGRTRMFVEDVLRLGDGAVVELDKLAGDPVDVFVNDRKVARGEVLVLNDNFCIRVSEILDVRESS
ncbi:MAG: flagellar motor switch protein FliN [Phycisphaerales bacterium]|nr:flagellar motor switch protein FliN [Phycisphaerales bacterium]